MKEFENYLEEIKRIAAQEGYDSLDETYVAHLRARFFKEDVIIGETKEFLLRELRIEDLGALYGFWEAGADQVLEVFIKETLEESEKNLKAYIEQMYPLFDYGIWAVEVKNTKEVIGLCGLGQCYIDGEMCTDLGYYICPKCRNLGIASQCIEIVLDYAKNYLEFGMIYAIIKEENRISKGILRKFGFEYLKKQHKMQVFRKILKE